MSEGLPSLELLEASHSFPCQFTFKVIGTADDHFVGRVLMAVKSQLDESAEPSFSTRSTPARRHMSVTVEPEVQNAEHVLQIYQELRGVQGLVMLM